MDLKHITSLSSARREIALQSNEIAKQDAELKLASKEMIVEKKEKRKRAAELVIANKELTVQQTEKQKRHKELITANRRLSVQCEYLKLCTSRLRLANRSLVKDNKAMDKQGKKLVLANGELVKGEAKQKVHIAGLSEMMYIISHKLRQPVVQILGLTSLLTTEGNAPADTVEMITLLRESAEFLDSYTRELTEFIHNQELKLSLNERASLTYSPTDISCSLPLSDLFKRLTF
jgi:hypothetical protein